MGKNEENRDNSSSSTNQHKSLTMTWGHWVKTQSILQTLKSPTGITRVSRWNNVFYRVKTCEAS